SFLQKKFPTHGFLAEENSKENLSAEILWIIDPLDGTVNFSKNIPHFGISIAAIQGTKILTGIILNPLTSEVFIAEKGKGAFCNNKQIKVSSVTSLDQTILATGFPYNIHENPKHCIEKLTYFLKLGVPIRRFGAASLDLSYVAAGKFDAYFETGLHPWDVAAGILLVQEAGGSVSTWEGLDYPLLKSPDILVSNTFLHNIMKDALLKGTTT
ncbi:MAG: inositol monophosphatase, partial [Verrucomicrobia bacterium]|nr:inositol monophosphatase [Verrucomicrobiota bacterium]